jgi:hypothetical protein
MSIRKFERRVCDRCGTEAEMPDDKVSRFWEKFSAPADGGGCLSIGGIPSHGDLCPSCRKALIGWWHEGKPPKQFDPETGRQLPEPSRIRAN